MRLRLDAAAWAVVGFAAALWLNSRTPKASGDGDGVVTVRELRVVGADGTTVVAVLGASADGGVFEVRDAAAAKSVVIAGSREGGRLAVHAPDGSRCAFLGCAAKSASGILSLGRKEDATRVMVGCGADGGYVSLFNERGWGAAFAGVAEGGTGVMQANGPDGGVCAQVSVGDGGGQIDVRTRDGKIVGALATPKDARGALLRISTREDDPAVEVGVTETGGAVTTFGRRSAPLAMLKAGDMGGQLAVYRADGVLAGSFSAFKDGAQASLLNHEGKPVVELHGEMNGGQVDVRTREGKDAVRMGVVPAGGQVTATDARGKAVTLPSK